MPAVLKNMGIEFFTEKYMADFLGTFRDEVDEVRTAAAETLPQLIAASTATWVQDKVFPSVKLLAADDFINRIAFLNSLNVRIKISFYVVIINIFVPKALMEVELPELFQNEVLTLMIASTNDEVPNVRLRAAQVLGLASMKIGVDGSRMQIRPILNELVAQDKDKDVKYFATEALKSC
jgi:HEAT repeat protein